jgi:tetratricopeptide (TPR) repeat protein
MAEPQDMADTTWSPASQFEGQSNPKIMISYRRRDTDAITGRIFDRLGGRYGKDSLYRDIDNIPPGIDFREHIDAALRRSDILVVVIGPKWLGRARGGRFRISEDSDFVRMEVEIGLKIGIPVIPVLIDETKMPDPAQLPAGLKDFTFRNAVRVDTGQDFDLHIDRLIRDIDRILKNEHSFKDKAAPNLPPQVEDRSTEFTPPSIASLENSGPGRPKINADIRREARSTQSAPEADKAARVARLATALDTVSRRKSSTRMGLLVVGLALLVLASVGYFVEHVALHRESASSAPSGRSIATDPAPAPSQPQPLASSPAPTETKIGAEEVEKRGAEAQARGDYADAMRWYREAADQGKPSAQNNIGDLYYYGWGVAKDYGEALRWYHKAADQGNAVAQFNIGTLYENGTGAPQDYAEAARWYLRAADQGNANGQFAVGMAYHLGLGVPRGDSQARRWFALAAAQGNEDAKEWLARLGPNPISKPQ